MPVEIRACTDEDELVEAFRTVMTTFAEEPSEEDVARAKATMPVDRTVVAVEDGRFVGAAGAWPFDVTIPGGELPCPGVTWVGVLPTHRRRGVLTAMMRFQLDDIHARGEPLAALWASESLIYGRFGYGISAPVHQMKATKSRFAFRELASAYLGGVTVHELAAAGHVEERTPGAVARADAMFRTPLPPFCPEVF